LFGQDVCDTYSGENRTLKEYSVTVRKQFIFVPRNLKKVYFMGKTKKMNILTLSGQFKQMFWRLWE